MYVAEYHVHVMVSGAIFFFLMGQPALFLSWFFRDVKGFHHWVRIAKKKEYKVHGERSRKVAECSILKVKAIARICGTTLAVILGVCSCKLPKYSLTGTRTASRRLKSTFQ